MAYLDPLHSSFIISFTKLLSLQVQTVVRNHVGLLVLATLEILKLNHFDPWDFHGPGADLGPDKWPWNHKATHASHALGAQPWPLGPGHR